MATLPFAWNRTSDDQDGIIADEILRQQNQVPSGDINAPRIPLNQAALTDGGYNPGAGLATSYSGPSSDTVVMGSPVPTGPVPAPIIDAPPPTTAELGPAPVPPRFNPMVGEDSGKFWHKGDTEHPVVSPTAVGDATTIQEARRQALSQYEPQKQHGWRRYLEPMAMGALAGMSNGSPFGALGGAAYGAFRGGFQPRAKDEAWKAGQVADVDAQEGRINEQRKTAAQIADLQQRPLDRAAALKQKQQGIDIHGRRVDDLGMQAAIDRYNKMDYAPGANPTLDEYFEDHGLHDLPAHKKDEPTQLEWSNGQLLRVPRKMGGQAESVQSGGQAVVDPRRQGNQTVTVTAGGVRQTLSNLTPAEAARISEAEAKRMDTAASSKRREDRLQATGGHDPGHKSLVGAASALSRYRAMATRATYYKNVDPAIFESIQQERNQLRDNMKKMYGNQIEFDEQGEPRGLVGTTIEGARSAFKDKNKREPTPAEVEAMQNHLDGVGPAALGVP